MGPTLWNPISNKSILVCCQYEMISFFEVLGVSLEHTLTFKRLFSNAQLAAVQFDLIVYKFYR